MKIGTHVSIANGLFNAPINASKVGAEVFQIFSRSPHGGPVKLITPEIAKKFNEEMKNRKFKNFYIHTPYFINFSSAKNNIYHGSISVVRQELERGSAIGAKAVMTHLGSFGDYPEKEGLSKVALALEKILDGYRGKTELLLEISAGAGRIVGDTFEELAEIIFHKKINKYDLGVCFDTCHAFASGYDLRNKKQVDGVLKRLDKILGIDKLRLVHANDCKCELGAHLDRHEHIGKGKIGIAGFEALVNHPHLKKLDWILETPKDDLSWDTRNIKILKKMRDE